MVEIKNAEVFGLERAMNAISNSFNVGEIDTLRTLTPGQYDLAKKLGSNMDPYQSHSAFLKGILVMFDIKTNGVFSFELQRYHFLELVMAQSTNHSMKKFMEEDSFNPFTKYVDSSVIDIVKKLYRKWETSKELLKTFYEENPKGSWKDEDKSKLEEQEKKLKRYVYECNEELIHTCPRGLELWATCTTNYLQLKTIVVQRFHHKHQEDWNNFVEFCYSLPHFRELCGFKGPEWDLDKGFPLAN